MAHYAAPIDAFGLVMIGLFVLLVVCVLALGRFYPGSGADVLDWKPTRSPEAEAENEIDDLEQMLAAQNEMRRRRGAPERTEDELTEEVRREQRELDARAAEFRRRNPEWPES